MRKLIYAPLVHDIWSKAEYPSKYPEYRIGKNPDKKLVKEFRDSFNAYWDKVESQLTQAKVQKVYHDSLTDESDLEDRIWSYRKNSDDSRNFKAVSRILDTGAILMQTESVAAMKKTNATLQKYYSTLVKLGISPDQMTLASGAKRRLSARDKYIAANINDTLENKETGVLFMGHYHKVDKILKKKYPSIKLERIDWDFDRLMEIYDILIRAHNEKIM